MDKHGATVWSIEGQHVDVSGVHSNGIMNNRTLSEFVQKYISIHIENVETLSI